MERTRVLASFHAYLAAVAARDYAKACAYLSARVKASLSELTKSEMPCQKALPVVFSPSASAIAASQDRGEVTKVRVRGDRGFVIYRAPGAKLYQLTMAREAEKWRTAAAIGAILVPSPAMFGH